MTAAPTAEIDLTALRHNLDVVRQYAPDSKIMAVVKANAYGHGLVRIAKSLERADAFAVARIDEGIRLRQAGIKHRIAILQGFNDEDDLRRIVDYQLEAVVHHQQQLERLEGAKVNNRLTVWLKIDTGMNRLGFKPEQVGQAMTRLALLTFVNQPVNLMTHLASADEKNNPFTLGQINLFNDVTAGYQGQRSVANSAGIFCWREAVTAWVRPGLMLYGISPFPDSTGIDLGLQPVMNLRSQLIAVKKVNKGETVGYGQSWICPRDTVYGVIAMGYGDGYPRYAKSGTPVLVNNQCVTLIGRVSMDMITVDLTSQPDAKPGDKVTLWGEGLPVEEIAGCAGTIPYTLVCGVTPRVQFVEV